MSLGGVDIASLALAIGNHDVAGPVAKFLVAFPLVYHYLGGLRHMYWDKNPSALETEDVTASSYIIIGVSAFLGSVLSIVSL